MTRFAFALIILTGCSSTVVPDGGDGALADASADSLSVCADSGSAPSPIRQIAPPSGAHLTGARPSFQLTGVSLTESTWVQACRDRPCTQVIATFTAHGPTVSADRDLPSGSVFWRGGAGPCIDASASSRTWELFVPNGRPPITAFWGSVPDLDGDGYADLAVVDSSDSTLWIYFGSSTGLSTQSPLVLRALGAVGIVGVAGDVDGDGFVDLVACDARGPNAVIIWGGVNARVAMRGTTLTPPASVGLGASACSGIGDIDGDGFADIGTAFGRNDTVPSPMVQAPTTPRLFFYRGAATSAQLQGPSTIATPAEIRVDRFGSSISDLGEYGPRGVSAAAVGMYVGDTSLVQEATIFFGQAGSLTTAPNQLIPNPPSRPVPDFADSVMAVGDVTGDGLPDLFVPQDSLATGTVNAYLYAGGASGVAPPPVFSMPINSLSTQDSVADLNGDGFIDLIGSDERVANVYPGHVGGFALTPSLAIPAPARVFFFHAGPVGADFNADGFDDLALGGMEIGSVFVHLGSATGISATPSQVLTGSGAAGSRFGTSLVP